MLRANNAALGYPSALISPWSDASSSWKAVSSVQRFRYKSATLMALAFSLGRLVRMWMVRSPSRVAWSNSTVIRRAKRISPSSLVRRTFCSQTSPVSQRPLDTRLPTGSQFNVEACWRVTNVPPRFVIPKRNAVVQKLRSLIHKSPGWTISRMASVIARSWACPSSQRTTSVISIRWGSSTTKAWPGKAPARVNRRGFEAMLGPGQVVAVKDLDAVALQPRLVAAAQLGDDGAEGRGRVPHQGGAGGRLDPVDLVVDRLLGDAQDGGHLLVGGVDRGSNAADHQAHQADDVREQELPRVLQLGVALEQGIDCGGRQGVLHQGSNHHANRGILDEPLKDVAMNHHCLPAWKSSTPCRATVYQNV